MILFIIKIIPFRVAILSQIVDCFCPTIGGIIMRSMQNWTSFNSGKLFSHINRWKKIRSLCPPPVLFTVDPANICNLNCKWCNAKVICSNKKMLSKKTLLQFADFIYKWEIEGFKVNAVCIAGGGEPLLNPNVGNFMRELNKLKIDVATVTNGTMIDKFIDDLLVNQYVAVSVDAATSKTFNECKNLEPNSNEFDKIINNIESLCTKSHAVKCNLGNDNPSNGVNYRMLITPENVSEIVEAARIAQDIGCKSLHVRPAATPFDGTSAISFSEDDIEIFKDQIRIVNENKKSSFGFYYTLNKFNDNLEKENDFSSCHAIFMTATLMPSQSDDQDAYCMNVCCDRRSDSKFCLISNSTDINEIARIWGSDTHWNIYKLIDKNQIEKICPRCTYYEHNMIYEKCIEHDDMLINFI